MRVTQKLTLLGVAGILFLAVSNLYIDVFKRVIEYFYPDALFRTSFSDAPGFSVILFLGYLNYILWGIAVIFLIIGRKIVSDKREMRTRLTSFGRLGLVIFSLSILSDMAGKSLLSLYNLGEDALYEWDLSRIETGVIIVSNIFLSMQVVFLYAAFPFILCGFEFFGENGAVKATQTLNRTGQWGFALLLLNAFWPFIEYPFYLIGINTGLLIFVRNIMFFPGLFLMSYGRILHFGTEEFLPQLTKIGKIGIGLLFLNMFWSYVEDFLFFTVYRGVYFMAAVFPLEKLFVIIGLPLVLLGVEFVQKESANNSQAVKNAAT